MRTNLGFENPELIPVVRRMIEVQQALGNWDAVSDNLEHIRFLVASNFGTQSEELLLAMENQAQWLLTNFYLGEQRRQSDNFLDARDLYRDIYRLSEKVYGEESEELYPWHYKRAYSLALLVQLLNTEDSFSGEIFNDVVRSDGPNRLEYGLRWGVVSASPFLGLGRQIAVVDGDGLLGQGYLRQCLGFINDILATRTKEESGNYYVKKFKVDAKENLDDGFNGGVYDATDTTSGGVSPTEANISLQLSSGCAYVQGYRTERLSTTYKDVEKPRTFTTEMNKTLTSDFGNFVLMTNLSKAPALYSTIEMKDNASSPLTIGKTRVINFAYESGPLTAGSTTSVYRANIIDTQFYTQITTSGSATGSAGDYVVGATSGATGYLVAGVSSTTTFLYNTNGTFVSGEVLNKNGVTTYGTISAVRAYGFGDVKTYAFTSGSADAVLDVKVALPGSGPILSNKSGSGVGQTATITSTLSNFASQLRIGDVVEFSNSNAIHKAKVTAVTNNFVFTISTITSASIANGALTSQVIRTRPELKEGDKKKLLTPLGYDAVKNTNNNNTINPSGRFRTSVEVTGISSTSVSVTAGSGLQWVNATDNDSFIVIVTSGTGDGQIMSNGNGFTTSSVNDSSASLTFSSAPSSIIAIGTVVSSDRSGKAKTTERMKVLEINDSLGSSNGLTQVTGGFGTRIEDSSISLGCADVFKIKAIYESTDSSSPQIPYFEYTNLLGSLSVDEVIEGVASGSRGRIVSTTGNRIYYIPVEDDKFTDGEYMT